MLDIRDVVESQPETFLVARRQQAGPAAHNGHALAQYELSIRIVEHAIDLNHFHWARPVVGNVARDLDHPLFHVAFGGLHLDAAQLQIVDVLLAFRGEHGCCGRVFPLPIIVRSPGA